MASNARYKGKRLRKPRTVDTYAAITETLQYSFDNPAPISDNVFIIEPGADMNQIKAFEPAFRPNVFINASSPLCNNMFTRYDEFRIRSCEVKFTPVIFNPTNQARSDAWIWWCPNHYEEDEDSKIGETFDNVQSLEEATRIQKVSILPGKSFLLKAIPQLTMINQALAVGGAVLDQHGDKTMPWVRTTATNRDDLLCRMPIVYFRRPYQPLLASQTAFDMQVMLTAIIEFRNLDDDN